jgi:hypothetical protein
MSSGNEVVETVDTAELIPGQRASRARVIAAGVTDDDIDELIKQAQQEVERLIYRNGINTP